MSHTIRGSAIRAIRMTRTAARCLDTSLRMGRRLATRDSSLRVWMTDPVTPQR